MNITREVITDLLPAYFSGEASEDTRTLVEDYFRENRDFERITRKAATPCHMLRASAKVSADVEAEKRGLDKIRGELQWRKWLFGGALFFTLAPLSVLVKGSTSWWIVRDDPLEAGFLWVIAAILWVVYLMRLRRRVGRLIAAIYLTVFPFIFTLHSIFPDLPGLHKELGIVVGAWVGAALAWTGYFYDLLPRGRRG